MTFASVSTILVAMYTLVEAGHWVQHLQQNFKLDGPAMTRIYSVSLEHCHEECFVRAACKSFSYYRTLQKCLLSGMDGTTVSGVKIPGVVTSEKRHWRNQLPDTGCENCTDVCVVDTGIDCITTGCGPASVLNGNSSIEGNMANVGSKVKHVCSNRPVFNVSECLSTGNWSLAEFICVECEDPPTVHGGVFVTPDGVGKGAIGTVQCNIQQPVVREPVPVNSAICQPSGEWNQTSFFCWAPVLAGFHEQTMKFVNPATYRYWHNNGWGDKKISIRYQPSDSFVVFDMTYQGDSTYKLWDYGAFVCDGYQTSMRSLHTRTKRCPSEDHTHFYIYTNANADTYLLKSKATDRFVRVDNDRFVTTYRNITDERALFRIIG